MQSQLGGGWGPPPLSPLINVLPIWESRLGTPPLRRARRLGEQRNPRLPSPKLAHSQHPAPTRSEGGWEGRDLTLLQRGGASSHSSLHPHPEILSCLLILSTSGQGLCPSLGGTETQLMGNLGNWVPQFSIHTRCPPLRLPAPRPRHPLVASSQSVSPPPRESRCAVSQRHRLPGPLPRTHTALPVRCHPLPLLLSFYCDKNT